MILDNGCQNSEMLAYLATLKQRYSWVNVTQSRKCRIIGGLRLCLEAASGRYVLPVDSDDWLYPDCLQVVTWHIREKGFPALLYTDEDKAIGAHAVQPYFKPDFDPVLLLNSAYIAHLGAIDPKAGVVARRLCRQKHGRQSRLGSVHAFFRGREGGCSCSGGCL